MILIVSQEKYLYEMRNLVALYFPGEPIEIRGEIPASGDYLSVKIQEGKAEISLSCGEQTLFREITMDPAQEKAELKLALAAAPMLQQVTGIVPPWGILTGVRPISLMLRGLQTEGETAVLNRFMNEYLVSEKKARLALDCAKTQLPFQKTDPREFSLYVGVPFCPSRCSYCSFVSQTTEREENLKEPYIDVVCREIDRIGAIAKKHSLKLKTVYFGGGTPTALWATLLKWIFSQIEESFDLSGLEEYTLEAGRCDTVTDAHIGAAKSSGITRICLNPQSMNDAVLAQNNRKHTAREFCDTFAKLRAAGFQNINSDLIAGLKGDTVEGFKKSLEDLLALAPEGITIHALTLKKASALKERGERELIRDGAAAAEMLNFADDRMRAAGYRPYYIYRQKNTVGGLENTGYCKPGYECIYNIRMMGDTQSILSVGAGGVTKLFDPGTGRIERIFNYKYAQEYINGFEEMEHRKAVIDRFFSEIL